jgi:methyl-accepting chemotaxis protein
MKKRSLSLAARIIGLTLILLAIIFTVLTFLVSSRINSGVYELQAQNVLGSAKQLRTTLDDTLSGISRRLYLVSRTEQMIKGMTADTRLELEKIARDSFQSETYFEYMAILDKQGKVLVNYPYKEQQGTLLNDQNFYDRVINGGEIQYIDQRGSLSPINGSPVIAMASPIMIDGSIEGIYLTMINLNRFSEVYIKPHVYGATGYAYLIDDKGVLLSHPTLPLVESSVWEYQFTKDMVQSSSSEGFVHYEWTDGWKYAYYSKMENFPWIVATSIYDDDLLSLSRSLQQSIILISLISLISLGVILFVSVIVFVAKPIGSISMRVSDGSQQLESASYQISSSSQQQASFSTELASSVEEISSSIEELQSVVEMNTKNINQSELMMRETNEGSQKVSRQMEELKIALLEINDNSQQIVKIIKVIEDIAFQTNILALNAAVEAARAGDAGRGFAVVADQVKDLAQKSASAANETALLIEKAIKSVARGEDLGEKVLSIQLKAGEMTQKVATLLDDVNRSSQEQMKGINQITAAISQTNQGVQQSAASTEETAAASEELLNQAGELSSLVDELNLLVKGKLVEKEKIGERTLINTERKSLSQNVTGESSAGKIHKSDSILKDKKLKK